MTQSRTIAGLLGPLWAAVGLSLLARPDAFADMAAGLAEAPALFYVSGMALIVAGVAIVRVHNVWTPGWPLIVTVFGWLAIAGGLTRMLFAQEMADLAVDVAAHRGLLLVGGAIVLALGAFLTFMAVRREA